MTVAFLCRLVVMTVSLVAGSCAFAAPDVSHDIEVLFQEVEQRVSAGHAVSPQGESALDAWGQVMLRVPHTDPVQLDKVLTAFADRMRQHGDEQKASGNTTLAAEFSLFASQAEGLKAHIFGSPEKASPLQAQPADPALPGKAAGRTCVVNPPPASPGPSKAKFYRQCGDQMFEAARKYYEYAAKAGDARAIAQLGRIKDDPARARPAPVLPSRPPEPLTQEATARTLGDFY